MRRQTDARFIAVCHHDRVRQADDNGGYAMRYKYEGDIATAKDQKVYRPHGRGKLTCYKDGGDPGCTADVYWIYEGAFASCHVTGQGRTIYGGQSDSPGYIYDGEHRDGTAHGQGTSFRSDGTKEYEGQWKSNECHGQGTWYRPDGTKEYEGEWESSYWHGQGTLFCPDGITPVHDGVRCWRNGSSFSDEDGSRYEGEWHDDGKQKHGWGIKYRPDGTIEHSGWWENDQPRDEPPPNDPDAS